MAVWGGAGSDPANGSPINTELPMISGAEIVGNTLEASTGTWMDVNGDELTFSYQWQADGVDLANATGSTYLLSDADLGSAIVVRITANDGKGGVNTASSLATGQVDHDLDEDGTTDSTDSDMDGDGIDDQWERDNGLDPRNPDDAAEDLDGDGLSNLEEYETDKDPKVDDNPPVVTPPEDITTDAVAIFTPVSPGTASALDTVDGSIVPTHDAPTHFSPGLNVIIWSATDKAGNTGTATQNISVNPMVSLSADQTVSEGSEVSFKVMLNGSAATYPVSVELSITGTALTDGSDHDLLDSIVAIDEGNEAIVTFTTVDDGPDEGTETVIVTLGAITNAVGGVNTVHNIDIVEGNVAPTVNLAATQGSGDTFTVSLSNGLVVVRSSVTDPNAGDTHVYDWSETAPDLMDEDDEPGTFTIDPAGLEEGFYLVSVTISDGQASDTAEMILLVLSSPRILSSTDDSDFDGLDDLTEGDGDEDGDRISNYLDGVKNNSGLQTFVGERTRYLIETLPGLRLKVGNTAFQSEAQQAMILMSDIIDKGGVGDDIRYSYPNGLIDLRISALPLASQNPINVVIPQISAIPSDAVYRVMTSTGWHDFTSDEDNAISSAAGEDGYCPPPGDEAYQIGLAEGDYCVQLTLEDGGPNDADDLTNNRISITGGMAQVEVVAQSEPTDLDDGDSLIIILPELCAGIIGCPQFR
jgi:hypothetical protein